MLSAADKADFELDGWVTHHVVVYENDSPAYENAADLCPVCAEKMRHAANPANWPRQNRTVGTFSVKSAA